MLSIYIILITLNTGCASELQVQVVKISNTYTPDQQIFIQEVNEWYFKAASWMILNCNQIENHGVMNLFSHSVPGKHTLLTSRSFHSLCLECFSWGTSSGKPSLTTFPSNLVATQADPNHKQVTNIPQICHHIVQQFFIAVARLALLLAWGLLKVIDLTIHLHPLLLIMYYLI